LKSDVTVEVVLVFHIHIGKLLISIALEKLLITFAHQVKKIYVERNRITSVCAFCIPLTETVCVLLFFFDTACEVQPTEVGTYFLAGILMNFLVKLRKSQ
jgi:hypothetical protein